MAAIERKDHLCRTIDISPRIIPVLRKRVNAVLSVDCRSQKDFKKEVLHPSQLRPALHTARQNASVGRRDALRIRYS